MATISTGKREKITTFLVCFLSVALCHAAIIAVLKQADLTPYMSVYLLPFLDLTLVEHSGVSAFGFVESNPWVLWLLRAAGTGIAILIAFGIYLLADVRFGFQHRLLQLLSASLLVRSGESLVSGHVTDYFDLHLGSWHLPAFGFNDLVATLSLLCLYLFAMLKFFKVAPRSRVSSVSFESSSSFVDPLFAKRHGLKLLLVVLLTLWLVGSVSFVVSTYFELLREVATREGVFSWQLMPTFGAQLTLAAMALGLNLLYLAQGIILWLLWIVIPDRPIEVAFLRAFKAEKSAWRTLRHLRRSLRKVARVTGVSDPDESRRLIYLPMWIIFPFMFSVGELSRVNALRNNIFLTGDWQAGINQLFSLMRIAVFDCSEVTENLAWEFERAVEVFGSDQVFLVYPVNSSPDAVEQLLAENGVRSGVLDVFPRSQYFAQNEVPTLADKVRHGITLIRNSKRNRARS